MKKYIWGVDVGGTTVKVGLFMSDGELVDRLVVVTRKENHGENILKDIAKSIEEYLQTHNIDKEEVLGIGLAMPGPVDSVGVIHGAVNLGWGAFNVSQAMQEITGLPVVSGNDANAAALGEIWQGAARGSLNMILLTLGTGVGGGIIIDGSVIAGHKGSAGEIGHILVNAHETERCTCGNYGCLEQYSSATGIVRMANKILKASDKNSSLRELASIEAKDVFDAAKQGDELALQVVDGFGKYLGKALGIIGTAIAPDVIVLGGGVSAAGDIIINTVGKYFREMAFHACKDIPIVLASLGNEAGIYGAARMVLNKYSIEQ